MEKQGTGAHIGFVCLWACASAQPAHQPERRGDRDKDKHRYSLGAASVSSLFLDPYKLWQLNTIWQAVPQFQSPTDLYCFESTSSKTGIFTFLLTL